MVQVEPPKPPPEPTVALDDDMRRMNFRMWQVFVTLITVVVTVWFMMLGPIIAILALMIAKHVLVAVLAAGLHVPAVKEPKGDSAG